MPISDRLTNQTMLNAIYLTAAELEESRFRLIEEAGLWPLFFQRGAVYTGPSPSQLPGLNPAERRILQRTLIELLARQSKAVATTLTHLNLRPGPGTHFGVLATLPPDTELRILEDQGDWLAVAVTGQNGSGQQGFVHRDYVARPAEAVQGELLANQPDLLAVPLPVPPSERLPVDGLSPQSLAHATVRFWNDSGRLLAVLANEMQLDPAVAVAVLLTESGGQGFAPGPGGRPRMMIRFENHVFFDRWGRANPQQFQRHFTYDSGKPWTQHQWRADPNRAWQGFHGNQNAEWQVYEFAASLDRQAAGMSISMGLPQIMGFNHRFVGYPSVDQMFDAFNSSEARQIFGLFDFVRSKNGIAPLRRGDFHSFAEIYNGPGQAAYYATLIRERVELFQSLQGRKREAPSRGIGPPEPLPPQEQPERTPPALPPVETPAPALPDATGQISQTVQSLLLAIVVAVVAIGLIGLFTGAHATALVLAAGAVLALALYGLWLLPKRFPTDE